MAKVRVRLLTSLGGPEIDWPVGSEVEIERDWAERLIERDYAELLEPRKGRLEKATREQRERAVHEEPKGR